MVSRNHSSSNLDKKRLFTRQAPSSLIDPYTGNQHITMASNNSSTYATDGSAKRYVLFLVSYPAPAMSSFLRLHKVCPIRGCLDISLTMFPFSSSKLSITYAPPAVRAISHTSHRPDRPPKRNTYSIERYINDSTKNNGKYAYSSTEESVQAHISNMSQQLDRFDAMFYERKNK